MGENIYPLNLTEDEIEFLKNYMKNTLLYTVPKYRKKARGNSVYIRMEENVKSITKKLDEVIINR